MAILDSTARPQREGPLDEYKLSLYCRQCSPPHGLRTHGQPHPREDKIMRLRIDTSENKFRVAALAQPRARSRTDQTQKTTPDGRPVWAVELTATDTGSNSVEMIWVEVAGEEPRLTLDELALVQGLVFAPWVNKKGEIVRNFRADSITVLTDARRAQAA